MIFVQSPFGILASAFLAISGSLALIAAPALSQDKRGPFPATLTWGPTKYASFDDSPFEDAFKLSTDGFYDTYERGKQLQHYIVSTGATRRPSTLTDSVDGDDGSIDGSGDGWSWLSENRGATVIFDRDAYGGFPGYAGVVTTDGCPCRISFFDPFGNVVHEVLDLEQNLDINTTDDDNFVGIWHDTGIGSIMIKGASERVEFDHLQYGYAQKETGDRIGDFDRDNYVGLLDYLLLERLVRPARNRTTPEVSLVPWADLHRDGVIDQLDLMTFWKLSDDAQGDTNQDGIVDFADFLRLSKYFEREKRQPVHGKFNYSHGNVDGDEFVTFNDFVILAANFGGTGRDYIGELALLREQAPLGKLAGVPEPSGLSLIAIGVIALTRRRDHRSRF